MFDYIWMTELDKTIKWELSYSYYLENCFKLNYSIASKYRLDFASRSIFSNSRRNEGGTSEKPKSRGNTNRHTCIVLILRVFVAWHLITLTWNKLSHPTPMLQQIHSISGVLWAELSLLHNVISSMGWISKKTMLAHLSSLFYL